MPDHAWPNFGPDGEQPPPAPEGHLRWSAAPFIIIKLFDGDDGTRPPPDAPFINSIQLASEDGSSVAGRTLRRDGTYVVTARVSNAGTAPTLMGFVSYRRVYGLDYVPMGERMVPEAVQPVCIEPGTEKLIVFTKPLHVPLDAPSDYMSVYVHAEDVMQDPLVHSFDPVRDRHVGAASYHFA